METYSCITSSSSSSSNHIRNLQSSYNRAAEAEQSMNYLQNTYHEQLLHVAAAMNSSSTGGDSTRNINDEIGSSSHEHKKEVLETEDINGEDGDYYDDEEEKKKKKTKASAEMKKVRRPRFAFQTRSQVDILDDGYRWRKYGQKAVKNNNFPRSYYRCTHQGCNVKKQVQRLSKDEEVVVTTYEGTHTHPIQTNTDNFEQILKQMHIYTTF